MQSMDGMLTTNGSLESYKAWYRKHFSIDKASEGKRIFIRFDGVYRDSTFFINGFYLDRHLSGYTAVTFDVTDFLVYGGDNVLSVKVDPRIPEGWWYDGAGIYRHVWLIEVPAVYALEEDVFVKTEVNLQEKTALLKVETTIHNTLLIPPYLRDREAVLFQAYLRFCRGYPKSYNLMRGCNSLHRHR